MFPTVITAAAARREHIPTAIIYGMLFQAYNRHNPRSQDAWGEYLCNSLTPRPSCNQLRNDRAIAPENKRGSSREKS